MKYLNQIFVYAISSILVFPTLADAENYTLDPAHTFVLWHINHMGFSYFAGKWFIQSGSLVLDPQHPEKSSVKAIINMEKVDTGLDDLNEHLQGPAFFDVSNYPTATFVSDKVTLTGKNSADVRGMLTLHGVSRPVVLKTILNKAGKHPYTKAEVVGFSATTTIKRSDYKIKTLLPSLGDDVNLDIEVEAQKTQAA